MKINKTIGIALLGLCLAAPLLSSVGTEGVHAGSRNVEYGGYWTYGSSWNQAWSHLGSSQRGHSSSAFKGSNSGYSGYVHRGTSYAMATNNWGGRSATYYQFY